jgi:DNA-binding transcriptional LysR family regulator
MDTATVKTSNKSLPGRIHVAQPDISQSVLDLEEELGVHLLLRDRRTVRLTAAGEILASDTLPGLDRSESSPDKL